MNANHEGRSAADSAGGVTPDDQSSKNPKSANIGFIAATALGIGGMMGAGLYTLLGLAAQSTGVWLPLAFVIAGIAGAFSVYSYSKLGATYPSRGGGAQFLIEEFGNNKLSGGLNVFQFVAYLIATSLYAAGFAEYIGVLVGSSLPSWGNKAIGAGVVILFALVNIVSSKLVGRSESLIVGIETVILVALLGIGAFKADFSRLSTEGSPEGLGLITGAALLYVTYQGFGVVTTASGSMANPKKELPRAMYSALIIVACIYVLVSTLVVTVLPLTEIEANAGHVLANLGQAVAGQVGFVVVAGAAILATASAVNATIFAASNIGYDVAEKKELSYFLTRVVWRNASVSLIITAVCVVLLVVFFPLNAVGQMTSLAFLIVYGAVSWGHLRVRSKTGAKRWPLIAATVINALLFVALLVDAIRGGEPMTWITLIALLILSFILEAIYRNRESRSATQQLTKSDPKNQH